MAVNDVWQVTLWYRQHVEQASIVRHWILDVEEETDLPVVGENLAAAVAIKFGEILEITSTASTALFCAEAQRILPTSSPVFTVFPQSLNGDAGGQESGAQEAMLVSLYTEYNFPQGRGRMYIPFLAEGMTSSGQILSAKAALLATPLAEALGVIVDQVDNEWSPVVYSRTLNAINRITYYLLRPVTGTQRRRRESRQNFSSAEPD